MKISIREYGQTSVTEKIEVEVGGREVELEGVFNGVGIKTDQGYYGISQRDMGLEVMLDGMLVWSSTTNPRPDSYIDLMEKTLVDVVEGNELSFRQEEAIKRLVEEPVCHCGQLVGDHGQSDNHMAVEMKRPCSTCGKEGCRPMDHAGWHPDDEKRG